MPRRHRCIDHADYDGAKEPEILCAQCWHIYDTLHHIVEVPQMTKQDLEVFLKGYGESTCR